MCLLYILTGVGVTLTLISGQYSEHVVLFWSFLGSIAGTAFFYKLHVSIMNDSRGQGPMTHQIIEILGGLLGFVAFGLFFWLAIVIWI